MELVELNERYALPGVLDFRHHASGLVFLEVAGPQAQARLCLQGAQLLLWQPRSSARPVIWLSEDARYAAGRNIRGGVPVCWPWFGPAAPGSGLPNHGFARNQHWEVLATALDAAGLVHVRLQLSDNPASRALWPHAFTATLDLQIGSELRIALTSHNRSDTECLLGEALHTYFAVSDVATARVDGLDGCRYSNTAEGGQAGRQTGSIGFDGEFDRVYLDAPAHCVLLDPPAGRRIDIRSQGAQSTIVWTPGPARAAQMGDLGPDGWRRMVCVESGNALENCVRLEPGARHTLAVHYAVHDQRG